MRDGNYAWTGAESLVSEYDHGGSKSEISSQLLRITNPLVETGSGFSNHESDFGAYEDSHIPWLPNITFRNETLY